MWLMHYATFSPQFASIVTLGDSRNLEEHGDHLQLLSDILWNVITLIIYSLTQRYGQLNRLHVSTRRRWPWKIREAMTNPGRRLQTVLLHLRPIVRAYAPLCLLCPGPTWHIMCKEEESRFVDTDYPCHLIAKCTQIFTSRDPKLADADPPQIKMFMICAPLTMRQQFK